MISDPLLVGIDLGTTNIKTLVFNPHGRLMAQASLPTPTHYPRPGWAYFNPEELWQATLTTLKQVIDHLKECGLNPKQIAGIAATSFGETGVPLDAHGQPTADAIAWFDQRSAPQMTWLANHIGQERLFAVSGLPLLVIYGLCKLLWLKENDPHAFERTRLWLPGADYIAYRLCGVPATDYSLASRTMAFNLYERRWADDLLADIGLTPHPFAPLASSGTNLGPILPQVAKAVGLSDHTQIAAGGHDHICGAFAIGVNKPGEVLNSFGTAEAIFLPLEKPLVDPIVGHQGYTQGLLGVKDQDFYFALGGLYTAGGSIEWLREVMSAGPHQDELIDYSTLISEAEQIPAGSLGVCFLPYLRLANPPHNDAKARGAFIGLSTDAKRGVLFRAVLEGLAYEVRLCLETILAHQGKPAADQIYVTGGGSRNRLYMRIKATTLNQPVTVVDVAEGVALGAAMMGGLGAGVYPDVASALQAVRYNRLQVNPQPELVDLYDHYYQQVYKHIHTTLRPLHHKLYDLQAKSLEMMEAKNINR